MMVEEPLPVSIGSAGLTGRPQIARPAPELEEPDGYDEQGNPVWDIPRAQGHAIPPNCLRVLSSPLPPDKGGGCSMDCPGLQRDGSCLCDTVRAANAQGIWWTFDIDRDGYWAYNGPEIKGGTMGYGYEYGEPPGAPVTSIGPPPVFTCPHCGTENEQDMSNFHFWCSKCGKNAKDPVEEKPKPARKRK